MKKTLIRIGWILLIAIVIFAIVWIIKTRWNAPSDEQLEKDRLQDSIQKEGDGGDLDKLDQLVSDDMDSTEMNIVLDSTDK